MSNHDPLTFGTTVFTGELSKEKAQAYMRSVIATLRVQGYFHQIGREAGEVALYSDAGELLCKIEPSNSARGDTYVIRGLASFQSEFKEHLPYV